MLKPALAALLCAALWVPGSAADDLKLQTGEPGTLGYTRPLSEIQAAAEAKDGEAQFLLGVHLLRGDGIAADPKAARDLIRLAAQQGHAVAQAWLARLAEDGIGGETSPAQALKWYRRAAQQGETAQVSVPLPPGLAAEELDTFKEIDEAEIAAPSPPTQVASMPSGNGEPAVQPAIPSARLSEDIGEEQAAVGMGAATGVKAKLQLVSLSPWAGEQAARLSQRLVLGDTHGLPKLEGPRVALAAGNSQYRHAPDLPNAANDALAVGALLETLGFDVVYAIDVPKNELVKLLDEFADRAEGAAVSFFYFAGHGVQVNGLNYLLPPEIDAASGKPLSDSAISLDDILELMQTRTKVSIVMLDACRDNPYLDSAVTAGAKVSKPRKRGFAAIDPVNTSTYIAFATAPDQVASDGADGNSPFAAALVKHLPTPGLEIDQAMRRVKREVKAATHQQQSPWTMGDLDVEVYLAADK